MNNNIQWRNSVNNIQWQDLIAEEFNSKQQASIATNNGLNLQLWRILFLLTLGLCIFNNF